MFAIVNFLKGEYIINNDQIPVTFRKWVATVVTCNASASLC